MVLLDELNVVVKAMADQDERAPFASRLVDAFAEQLSDHDLHLLFSQESCRTEQDLLLCIISTAVELND